MASEISIRVRATNEASAALRETAREAGLLNASVDDLRGTMARYDERARAAKDDLGKLDAAVRQHREGLRSLAAQYAQTGDAAERLDIGKQMDKIQSDLSRDLRVRKIRLDELVDIKSARGVADKLLSELESTWGSRASGQLTALGAKIGGTLGESIGASAGAVAGPLLTSVLGGAISGGAGALGIGAAVMLAIKSDASLQEAGKQLGKDIFGQITQSAHTAFAEPIAREIQVLGRYGDQVAAQWGKAFESLAPAFEPFATTIAGTITKISGAIAEIAGDSGPVLQSLATGFDDIGDSLTGLLRNITDEGGQNADAIAMLTQVTAGAIDVLSMFVSVLQTVAWPLQEIYKASVNAGEGIGSIAVALGFGGDALHGFKAVQLDTNEALTSGAAAVYQETDALKGLADQLKAQTDPAFALIAAQRDLADAQTDYDKAVKKGGKSSADAKDKLIDLAKAAIGLESAAEKASGTLDGSVSPSLRATLKAAGLTDGAIDGVAKSFRDAKKSGDSFSKKYQAQIEVKNAESSKKKIEAAWEAAKRYAGQYTAGLAVKISRIDAGHEGPQAGANKATGGIVGAAATGATSSGMTWVGEQGPELVSLPAGTRVMSSVDSTRGHTGDASHYQDDIRARLGKNKRNQFDSRKNAGNPVIHVNIGRHKLAEIMIPAIQDWVSATAGGDVSALSGRR